MVDIKEKEGYIERI